AEPVVTALALKLYNEKLPGRLMPHLAAIAATMDTASLEEARAELQKRNKAASARARQAARTRAKREAEGKVARAANARMYAKKPEERQAAEERLKEAQETLRVLKEAHAAAEEQEAQAETQEALRALKGNGSRAQEAL